MDILEYINYVNLSVSFYICDVATRKIKITYVAHAIFVLYSADLGQFYEDPKTSFQVSVTAFAGEN